MAATNGETTRFVNGLRVRKIPPKFEAEVAGEHDSPNKILEDESSRLKDALKSCRNVLANYRAMLKDSSNDNPGEDIAKDDSEIG